MRTAKIGCTPRWCGVTVGVGGRKLVIGYATDMLSLSKDEVIALCEQGRIPGALKRETGAWVFDEDEFNDWWADHGGRPFDTPAR